MIRHLNRITRLFKYTSYIESSYRTKNVIKNLSRAFDKAKKEMEEDLMDQQKPTQTPKKNQLLCNAMGLEPAQVLYRVRNVDIEKTVVEWLKANGIDTSNISIRVLLRSEIEHSKYARKAGKETSLPFVVAVFKQLMEDDYEEHYAIDRGIMKAIRRQVTNFKDSSQIQLRSDNQMNSVLKRLNDQEDVKWYLDHQHRLAYSFINPDNVLAMCFELTSGDMNKFTFAVTNTKLRSVMNYATRRREFTMNLLYSPVRKNNHPTTDYVNFMK